MKPQKVRLDTTSKILWIGKRKFRLDRELRTRDDVKGAIFKPVSETEYQRRLSKIAAYLVESSKLTAHNVLKNALTELDMETVRKIEKQIRTRKRARVRDGCMSMRTGKVDIPLIG